MSEPERPSIAERFYRRLTARPRAVLAAAAVVVVACGAFVPSIRQDSRVEAFLPPGKDVLRLRDTIRERFGMADPMAILVVNDGPDGIFTRHTLELVATLTEEAQAIEGVDPKGVTSLATVQVPEPSDEGLALVSAIGANADAAKARAVVARHETLGESLVSADGHSTIVVIERFDSEAGERIHDALVAVAGAADVTGGERLHVAGHGALTATLGEYIDSDTRVLYVAVTAVIAVVLAVAFRTVAGVVLPLVLIGATLAVCLGSMGMTSAPFTVISSALPVVISALVVTDGLHILSLYYQHRAERPAAPPRDVVVSSMTEIWRPCVGARVTDIAGFAGLYLGSEMPPMKTFGLFGSIAIVAELALALGAYPCLLVLVQPGPSGVFARGRKSASASSALRWLHRFAPTSTRQSAVVLGAAALVVAAGATGMARMVVNDSWVGNFDLDSPVRIAAEELDRRHGIMTDLDLVVDAGSPEGMLEPAALEKVRALEQRLESLPYVTQAHSIGEVFRDVAHANAGPNGARAAGALPGSREAAAQTLLVADSGVVGRWLDGDQQRALVRAHTRARDYLMEVRLLDAVRRLVRELFAGSELTVTTGGMLVVGWTWVSSVGSFHLLSTVLSVGFCWLQMMAGFRSIALGSLAIVPTLAAMLLMYAAMGWGGIALGVGTSMFAALAIGTGVDFAIHTLDRFLVLRDRGMTGLDAMMAEVVPTTGRATFYSAVTIVLGFAVLCTSSIPAVRSLGLLVTIAVVASFAATFTVLPALIHVLRPRGLVGARS